MPTGSTARQEAVPWGYAKRTPEKCDQIHQRITFTGFGVKGDKACEVHTDRGTLTAECVLQIAAGINGQIAALAGIELPIRCLPLKAIVERDSIPLVGQSVPWTDHCSS